MKLSNYIIDLGRTVAYHPGLKRLTDSTTSTILLCQFLYWSDKTRDNGWIWKNSDEIEEETGLTYNEQKTARRNLKKRGLIQEENKKLDHKIRFKVNQEELNSQWEQLTGKTSEAIEQKNKETTVSKADKEEAERKERKDTLAKNVIKEKIEKTLNVLPNTKKWTSFVNFAYERERDKKEDIDVFLNWAIKEGYSPIYWPPDKMKSMWPQAFIKKVVGRDEHFVKTAPVKQEQKEYAPMPKELNRKRSIY